MSNFKNNSENITGRPGLYRVWVSLHDDGKAPLISIWIDPTMNTFERQQHHEDIGLSETSEDAMAKGNQGDPTFQHRPN